MVFFEQLHFDPSRKAGPPNEIIRAKNHLKQDSSILGHSRNPDIPEDSDPTKSVELLFKGMVLTPTKDRQYIRNFLNFRLKKRILDNNYKMNP